MDTNKKPRGPMYFRDGALGMKQFQDLSHPQQKDYVASLLLVEEDKLDFRDKHILNFFTKVYFPELSRKEENKKTITMDVK